MTFQEFLEKTYNFLKANECDWLAESYLKPETHLKRVNLDQRYDNGLTFSVSWSMGGTCGHYDGSGVSEVEADMEPENPKELDLILECVAPHLSFLQYKGIVREVMQRGTTHDSDWYGGATSTGHKGFHIEALFEALQKRDLI